MPVTFEKDLLKSSANIVRRIDTTAAARFEAAKRHEKKHRLSSVSTIIFSGYAILFSMAATSIPPEYQNYSDLATTVSIFMSALIISFTLFESTKRHDVRSELYYKCGINLREISDNFRHAVESKNANWESMSSVLKEYHKQLANYTYNHSNIDYKMAMIRNERLELNGNGLKMAWIYVVYYTHVWWLVAYALLSPFILVLVIVAVREITKLYFI